MEIASLEQSSKFGFNRIQIFHLLPVRQTILAWTQETYCDAKLLPEVLVACHTPQACVEAPHEWLAVQLARG